MPRKQYAARVGGGGERRRPGGCLFPGTSPARRRALLDHAVLVAKRDRGRVFRVELVLNALPPSREHDRQVLGRSRSARSYSSRSTSLADVRFT